MILVAVEGDTDVPFVERLCGASGFVAQTPLLGRNGKPSLARVIEAFAKAGRGSPHLVVLDLDRDAPCAGEWIAREAPRSAGPYFSLRLAVRAVEAWFLADTACAAHALGVRESVIPTLPDDEDDPKLTIVNLARKFAKPRIREALVPAAGMSRKSGPGYSAWLIEAGSKWSFERAVHRSPSLKRAHLRLRAMRTAWDLRMGTIE